MRYNYGRSGAEKARLALVAIALILILALGVMVVVGLITKEEGVILPKEEILSRVESYDGFASSVAAYLDDLGIGAFDKTRLRDVEFIYEKYYYRDDIKSDLEIAKEVAKLFALHYYDEVDLANEAEVTELLANLYIFSLGDTYGIYRNAEEYEDYNTDMSGSFVGIGVSISTADPEPVDSITVLSVFEGSGAEEAGILEGDRITAVNGVPVRELGYDGAESAIRGEEGSTVEISLLRGEEAMTLTVRRAYVEEKVVEYVIDDNKIAYIIITRFKDNTDEQLSEALWEARRDGARGIIFDLRSNPGGYLDAVLNCIEMLVPKGHRMASYHQRGYDEQVYTSENEDFLELPCAVLCNEGTASAGELFTAAVRDFRNAGLLKAVTVGKTTYGKGVMQYSYPFLDGAALTLTVSYYNPPSNVNYEGIGIKPDFEVELPQDSETDTQYVKAYEELMKLANNG